MGASRKRNTKTNKNKHKKSEVATKPAKFVTSQDLIDIQANILDNMEYINLANHAEITTWFKRMSVMLSVLDSAYCYYLDSNNVERLTVNPDFINKIDTLHILGAFAFVAIGVGLQALLLTQEKNSFGQAKKIKDDLEKQCKAIVLQSDARKFLNELEGKNALNAELFDKNIKSNMSELTNLAFVYGFLIVLIQSPRTYLFTLVSIFNLFFSAYQLTKDLDAVPEEIEAKKDFFKKVLNGMLITDKDISTNITDFSVSSSIVINVKEYNNKEKPEHRKNSPIAAQILKNALVKKGYNVTDVKGSVITLPGDCNIIESADEFRRYVQNEFDNYFDKKANIKLLGKQIERIAKTMKTLSYNLLEINASEHSTKFVLNIPYEYSAVINFETIQSLFVDCAVSKLEDAIAVRGYTPCDEIQLNDLIQKLDIIATKYAQTTSNNANSNQLDDNADKSNKSKADANQKDNEDNEYKSKKTNKASAKTTTDSNNNDNNKKVESQTLVPAKVITWPNGITFNSQDENSDVYAVSGKNFPANCFYSYFAMEQDEFIDDDNEHTIYNRFKQMAKDAHHVGNDRGATGIKLFKSPKEVKDSDNQPFLASGELKGLGRDDRVGKIGNRRVYCQQFQAPTGDQLLLWRSYDPDPHEKPKKGL